MSKRLPVVPPITDDEIFDEPPRQRADCAGGFRPCPWITCKHHLFLDVNPLTGSLKLNFPDAEDKPIELNRLEHMAETCALDVAERGGMTLEDVGELMNLTRERIRQIEVRALMKVRENGGFEPDDD